MTLPPLPRRLIGATLALALSLPAAPPVFAQKDKDKGRQLVTLNFVNAEIEAVSRAMAAILERQIIVDPRIKGTMTLYSEQPLTPREAYMNYLAALRGLGHTVVEVAGLWKVVPEGDAKLQTGTVSVGQVQRSGDQIITQIFRLQHENANNLVAVLRPLIAPNNTINANPGNNSLVITDYADNLQRIARIIAAMDVPAATDLEVIPLQHAIASDLAVVVQRLSDAQPAAAGGAATPGSVQVLADARTNALLVRAPNPARLAGVKSLIEKLDRPTAGGAGAAGNVHVVYLRNADATKLAQVLRASFGGGAGGGGTGASAGTGATTLNQAGTAGAAGAAGGASAQSAAPVGASAQPSTGGFIQADPSTNSLVITAPEPVYKQMRAVIDQLDARRAQIYIESMIVEVSGDNAADFGFQWQGLIGKDGDKNGLIAGTNFGTAGNIITLSGAAATGSVNVGQGLNIGLIRDFGSAYGLAAIARALQSQTNTNIQSTPNLITLDNEEAKIVVGSNVPFVTGQFTSTGSSTTNPFQTIERKDVGLTLRIRPQVGEGNTVRMTIYQESSSVSDKVAPGTANAGPSTDKRSIESTVTVDDGQIIVLGGLIEDKFVQTQSKVPVLGDIPFLGALFRSESRTKTRTNLMVFLRPVVMRDSESVGRLSLDRYDLMRGRQEAAQPAPSLLAPLGPAAPVPGQPGVRGGAQSQLPPGPQPGVPRPLGGDQRNMPPASTPAAPPVSAPAPSTTAPETAVTAPVSSGTPPTGR
jgi:general secretion pathway protein D